jgi:hypothetical protein
MVLLEKSLQTFTTFLPCRRCLSVRKKSNVGVAITTTFLSTQNGFEMARGTIYNGAKVTITHRGSLTVPYRYRLVSAGAVPTW